MVNIGFGVQIVDTKFRKSYRCIVDSYKVTDIIWERLKQYIPDGLMPGYEPLCLNERLRFLRYDEGDFFASHNDGTFEKPATRDSVKQTSMVTL